MSRKSPQRDQNADVAIEVVDSNQAARPIYVDGLHSFEFDGSLLRMAFFTVRDDSTESCQRRDVACRLEMPTRDFIAFANFVNYEVVKFVMLQKLGEDVEN